MFVSLHIGKTAGITFKYILRRNFGDKLLGIYSPTIREHLGDERVIPSVKPINEDEFCGILDHYSDVECVSSHYIAFPNRFKHFKVMTFLRNPVERVISHFFSFRRKYLDLSVDEFPDHMKYDYRNDMNLFFKHWDYVSSEYGVHNHCENYQTYVIDNNLDIDKALTRINDEFWFVGTVERFDEGLLLLRDQFRKLGRSFDIKYMRQHVAANLAGGIYRESVRKAVRRQRKEKAILVTDEIRERIKEMNQMDYILYEQAKKIVNERSSDYSGDLDSDLHNFRKELKPWQFNHQLLFHSKRIYERYVPYKGRAVITKIRNNFR